MDRRIAMEVEHRMDAREKEVKIKVETSTKGVHHYEASIRTTGEDLNIDLLFEEAMHLVDRMDTAMASKNTGLLD
jgi:hypothetical protein